MNRSGLNGFGSTLRAEQMAYRITGIIRSLNDEAERKPNKRMSFVRACKGLTRHPHPPESLYVIPKAFRNIELVIRACFQDA